ncbi:MAG: precorrin-2 C(20)-methyltransferase [Alphaproteobacteria bacterium]|nr:precorrin-2 C(20)-methyltransferase [Alphaproteobacteria bacterium]
MSGTLYGIGVGPGDPELMTVKAWRLVSTARAIAYLCANGGDSTALEIARPFLPERYEAIAIDMPMKVEREAGQAAYDHGCQRIATVLETGTDVVFLCEGDPFFYGSFMYVFERLAERHSVVVVPGVTSLTAAAAELRQPLVERDEVLKVLPATMPAEKLQAELATANAAAIIKVGRHLPKVKAVLAALGLQGQAISHATQPRQSIRTLSELESDTLPYFTTIIVRRK